MTQTLFDPIVGTGVVLTSSAICLFLAIRLALRLHLK